MIQISSWNVIVIGEDHFLIVTEFKNISLEWQFNYVYRTPFLLTLKSSASNIQQHAFPLVSLWNYFWHERLLDEMCCILYPLFLITLPISVPLNNSWQNYSASFTKLQYLFLKALLLIQNQRKKFDIPL